MDFLYAQKPLNKNNFRENSVVGFWYQNQNSELLKWTFPLSIKNVSIKAQVFGEMYHLGLLRQNFAPEEKPQNVHQLMFCSEMCTRRRDRWGSDFFNFTPF